MDRRRSCDDGSLAEDGAVKVLDLALIGDDGVGVAKVGNEEAGVA